MKIKKLKYIFSFLLCSSFFLGGVSLGEVNCGNMMNGHINPPYTQECHSYASQGTSDWYDNTSPLDASGNLFLKMIGSGWISCDSNNVASIQTKMQSVGGTCSTRVDGMAGECMRRSISTCPTVACNGSNKKTPRLQGSSLACDAGYGIYMQNFISCCVEFPSVGAPTLTQESWDNRLDISVVIEVSDSYFIDPIDGCDDTDKIRVINADGEDISNKKNVNCDYNETSVVCELSINSTGSDLTVIVEEGFYTISDEADNIVRSSSQVEQIFDWEGGEITGPTIEQVSWEGNTLVVNITYELVGIDSPSVDCRTPDKIEIVGGTQNGSVPNASVPSCQLTITTEGDEVTINVKSGVIVGGGMESSPGSQTLTKPQDCGSTPNTESGCVASYGPSYTLSGDCCVTQCSTPQNTGGGCNMGYIESGSCCVENNCQNPPLTGTDCSNQFGGRGVYSGTIQCCIDGGSCVNSPVSSGQCSGNLVLDSSGQCCVTCQNPVNDSGTCQTGYTAQGSCCFADDMCGDDMINEGGQCKNCEDGTIPNGSHTKCICDSSKKCCGIQLNTVVPFIGDCIEMNTDSSRGDTTSVTSMTAFPILVQGLMKILMSAIMVFSFLMVIIAGLMMTTGAFSSGNFAKGKTILKNVIISLILLGCSGLILSLVNPSFFK